jgi:transposase
MIKQKAFAPCGDKILGVDKGYTEAFADSEGNFYGSELGKVLTEGTKKRDIRGKARNKLYAIAKKEPHKAKNIYRFNLGRKKLERCNLKQKEIIRGIAFEAAHKIVDEAKEVRAEDLRYSSVKKGKFAGFNRTISSWTKGALSEALESVTKARGSCLRLVNASYTSQMDSKTGRLEGRRVNDQFYHANGEVSHADTNAAVNIKARADDTEIGLFTPYQEVKKILLGRLTAEGGVRNVPTAPPGLQLRPQKRHQRRANDQRPSNVTFA